MAVKMKIAVVTGSTKGIGRAIGIKLLDEGYYVVFNYANDDAGKLSLEDCLNSRGHIHYEVIKNDFQDELKINRFVEDIDERLGAVDVLVLNAGITDRTTWKQLSIEQWNRVMHVNLTVPAFLIQKFAVRMRSGSVLCIGSVLGEYAHSVSVPYGVSKAGLHFLVKSLVKEYCDQGITVNGIATGFTDTEWQKQKTEEQRKRIENKIAIGRFAQPEEIADIAYDILTNRYMTGSVVSIDGGYCCR